MISSRPSTVTRLEVGSSKSCTGVAPADWTLGVLCWGASSESGGGDRAGAKEAGRPFGVVRLGSHDLARDREARNGDRDPREDRGGVRETRRFGDSEGVTVPWDEATRTFSGCLSLLAARLSPGPVAGKVEGVVK